MEANMDDNETSNRYRKFGLPSWMVNNIERLNFVTDFEQYACSPPETEGFLSDHADSHDLHDTSESYCPVVEPNDFVAEKPKIQLESQVDMETKQPPSPVFSSGEELASPSFHSLLGSRKHEDFFSSPDSTPCVTPCATPEPSPAPRRKMSGQQDTVQTNPGRWFYLGNFKKSDQNLKGQSLNICDSKVNKIKSLERCGDNSFKEKGTPIKSKKDGIKLVISNFDINAISPTSW